MKFRKKSVVIEAVQWTGGNAVALLDWVGETATQDGASIFITTLEGDMEASLGDWIIKEPFPTPSRTFYPCKPDIFEATYEKVIK